MSNNPFDMAGFLAENEDDNPIDKELSDKVVADLLDGKCDALLIKKFYESAKNKNLKELSEIIPLVGGMGFTFTKNGTTTSIFYCTSSLCMLEDYNGITHEVSLNEI